MLLGAILVSAGRIGPAAAAQGTIKSDDPKTDSITLSTAKPRPFGRRRGRNAEGWRGGQRRLFDHDRKDDSLKGSGRQNRLSRDARAGTRVVRASKPVYRLPTVDRVRKLNNRKRMGARI
ncbi:hypothetical protein [Kaistia terrae]|uniref:Uncharacterized protein n=1 Tax=Kaistia terrae TaxID=537017 RepID=A0ABW0Q1N8_9HYPH|nr:hypothetical protein [Kaistia terrae]